MANPDSNKVTVLSVEGDRVRVELPKAQLRGFRELFSALERVLAPEPIDPDPQCSKCHGTGEAPNAQFRCACVWRHLRELK